MKKLSSIFICVIAVLCGVICIPAKSAHCMELQPTMQENGNSCYGFVTHQMTMLIKNTPIGYTNPFSPEDDDDEESIAPTYDITGIFSSTLFSNVESLMKKAFFPFFIVDAILYFAVLKDEKKKQMCKVSMIMLCVVYVFVRCRVVVGETIQDIINTISSATSE